jgi:lysophospholipase L1-like esterase
MKVAIMSVLATASAVFGQVRVVGPWQVEVGPGTVNGIAIEAQRLDVPPQTAIEVRGEPQALPVFKTKGGGWGRGAKLRKLVTQECTAAGNLIPASLKVRTKDGKELVRGTDWDADDHWATIGRLAGGMIADRQPVVIDYDYCPNRMHLVVVDAKGKARLIVGEPGTGIQPMPETKAGETRLATVWLSGPVEKLTDDNLLLVDGTPLPKSGWEGSAETLCPKTLAKLRAGEPVTIVAWGDSVTNGGGIRGNRDAWYQHVFHKQIQARFPKSKITLLTASWPGGNSRGYMSAPAGGKYDFKRDVLDPKPDLVTIEFVNDAGWKGDALKQHYSKIREILQGNGSEIILITPHFVRPDWMGITNIKFDDDPRPYVQGLREFARENRLPVADASLYWGHLWREGIPYMTLLGNSINHPDERGHRFFAEALMGVFPKK